MLHECLCFQLGKMSKHITEHYRHHINSFNLTHPQYFMLMAVIEFEGCSQTELADHTNSDRTTTTGLIDRLERDNWVNRQPDPNDRRILRIFLSPKGKKNRNKLIDIYNSVNESFRKRYSVKEWKQFQNLLNKLK